ncbi:hypothetical protein D9M69_656590 [compost metagenome]
MEALLTVGQQLEARNQLRLGKQKHMRTSLAVARRQSQQAGQRRIAQLFGIVDQQVNVLASQGQLPDLRQNRLRL